MNNFISHSMKKIFKIIVKIFAWIAIVVIGLYLFISFVVIPIAVPWIAKTQGTKILSHPVSLGGAWFNPFTLDLNLYGLKILDTDKQVIFGFKKFRVDVSFLSLLKKQLHIELINIDGLNLNLVLLADNQLNILSLVPKSTQATNPPKESNADLPIKESNADAPKSMAIEPSALPDVKIDSITLENGVVNFSDKCIAPGFSTRLSEMNLGVTGVSTKPDSQVKIIYKCKLDEKGKIDIQTQIKPFEKQLQMETTFSLNNYAMHALTPYVGKYTGHAVKDGGNLDIKVDYKIENNKLVASHKLFVENFDFGEKVESKDALSLPFGLVLALLEDTQNRINISLPVHGDISSPKFEYFHLLGQVAVNFFMNIVTSPFKALLSMVPSGVEGSEEVSTVTFAPGSAVLTDEAKKTIDVLVKAMKERPKVALEINGSYDSNADWRAIKNKVFDTDLATRSKESKRGDMRIFKFMFEEEFGLREYWVLERQYTNNGKLDEESLKREIQRRIIENGAPDKAGLEALGQSRAQVVYDLLVAAGVDIARVSIGVVRETKINMDLIPLEFTLTVVN